MGRHSIDRACILAARLHNGNETEAVSAAAGKNLWALLAACLPRELIRPVERQWKGRLAAMKPRPALQIPFNLTWYSLDDVTRWTGIIILPFPPRGGSFFFSWFVGIVLWENKYVVGTNFTRVVYSM